MMNEGQKRIFIFLSFFIGTMVLILGAFFGWRYINLNSASPVSNAPINNGGVSIFPSIGGGSSVPGGTTETESEVTEAPETPSVYQVSTKPVSGYIVTRSGGEWVVRYVDRSTGNIYESSLEHAWHKRITNTVRTGIEEAVFTSSSTVLLRSEGNTVETTYGRIAATSTGEFRPLLLTSLPANITWLSARGNDIFYLQKDEEGGAAGFLLNQERRTSSRVFSYPLSEWIPKLVEGNKVFLQSKASAHLPGGLFLLSGSASNPTPLLLGDYGLAALPNDKGTHVLVSRIIANVPQLSLLEVATKRSSVLPLSTFAEKCAWGTASSSVAYCMMPKSIEQGIYPDEWYTGEKGFADALWKVDTSSGNLKFMEKFDEEDVDAINVSVSPEDRFLLFINKDDLSLWSVRLSK